MKRSVIVAALALAGISGQAGADCSTGLILNASYLRDTVLGNHTVCGVPGPAYTGSPDDRWQEEHHPGGALWDYKLGPGNPVDPRELVGQWAVIGFGFTTAVRYDYLDGSSFTYRVYENPPNSGQLSFCTGAGEVVTATTTGIGGGC